MAIQIEEHEEALHPWHQTPGWSLMFLEADTEEQLNTQIEIEMACSFWQSWIVGFVGCDKNDPARRPGAVLYKPQGCNEDWEEDESDKNIAGWRPKE